MGAALVVSSRDGDLDEMRVLIQAGASVDAVDADGILTHTCSLAHT